MKNIRLCRLAIFVLVSSFLAVFVIGCNKNQAFDADKALTRLLSEVRYEAELEDVSDLAGFVFGDLPEGVEIKMYMTDGTCTDTVMRFKSSDKAAVRSVLDEYLASLKKEADRYNPQELSKLDNALIFEKGDYVFCCVTSDSAAAKRIFD